MYLPSRLTASHETPKKKKKKLTKLSINYQFLFFSHVFHIGLILSFHMEEEGCLKEGLKETRGKLKKGKIITRRYKLQ